MGKPKTADCCTKYCTALLAISNHTDHCEHVGPWQVSFAKGGHNKQNQLNNLIYGENTHLENSQFRTLVLLFGPWWQFLIVNTSSALLQVVFSLALLHNTKRISIAAAMQILQEISGVGLCSLNMDQNHGIV
jgi:hypothetical protein